MVRKQAECGTDSGYHRHRRNDEQACKACKAAHCAALRRGERAADRARRELAHAYPDEYQRLYIRHLWETQT